MSLPVGPGEVGNLESKLHDDLPLSFAYSDICPAQRRIIIARAGRSGERGETPEIRHIKIGSLERERSPDDRCGVSCPEWAQPLLPEPSPKRAQAGRHSRSFLWRRSRVLRYVRRAGGSVD